MRRSVQCLIAVGIFVVMGTVPANAVSADVVISHVQAGAASGQTASALQEFVVLYNNSSLDVNVTDWCVSNNRTTPIDFACVRSSSSNQKIYLEAYAYLIIVSDHFSLQHDNYQADVLFPTTNSTSGSIQGSAEQLTLKNASGSAIDSVTWSTTASSPTAGYVLQRNMSSDFKSLIETDSMAADFSRVLGVALPKSGVYEVVIDACANLEGIQNDIPAGLLGDENGNCVVDMCANLDGLQITIPEEYLRSSGNNCVFDYVVLQITELLPNAAGSDSGREYIELYNPSDRDAFLINYLLKIGDKTYGFPASLKLAPGQYMAFYNNEISFTFVNTTSHAMLLGDDGSTISQSDIYNDPKDDMAWALIDGAWQYTNQMTFAAANVASMLDLEETDASVGLQPCASNQYRHPATNRCRLLVTVASVAAACKDGQYRSEETNRCRTIALSGGTLTPCKENQYRSEETNRCRNLATLTSTLTPCKDNQYRSEETNRCRNIATTSSAVPAYAVEPIAETGTAFVGWYALGGVGVLAGGYAVWEWRREALSAIRRAVSFFTQR